MTSPGSLPRSLRERNRRGEGTRLREEILDAAMRMICDSGSEESVTLRAVAREVGISAPSIYAHFPDREAIVGAVVDKVFAQFIEALRKNADEIADPVVRLRAGCQNYLDFARESPNRYRVMFGRVETPHPAGYEMTPIQRETFGYLVDAIQRGIDAGRST